MKKEKKRKKRKKRKREKKIFNYPAFRTIWDCTSSKTKKEERN